MSPSRTVLDVTAAFALGLGRLRDKGSPTPDDRTYFALLIDRCDLPIREKAILASAADARLNALGAARRNDLDAAHGLFLEAETLASQGDLSGLASALAQSFQLAGAAYVEYRRGRFQCARSHLDQAIGIDRQLEQNGAPSLLRLHRIQLLHNHVRLDVRSGAFNRGLELAWYLLSVLEGRPAGLGDSARISLDGLTDPPVDILSALFDQVLTDIVMLATPPAADTNALLRRCAVHSEDESACAPYREAHDWFRLKRDFLTNPESFLVRCCARLEDGFGGRRSLWLATAMDAIVAVGQIDPSSAQAMTLDLSFQGLQELEPALLRVGAYLATL